MFELEVYKTIKAPVPTFHVGDKVLIEFRYGKTTVAGIVTKVSRVWMEARYTNLGGNPTLEGFRMDTLMSPTGNKIISPELEEFNVLVEKAKTNLYKKGILFRTDVTRNDAQLIFYLSDAVDDFCGPDTPEPLAKREMELLHPSTEEEEK